MSETLFTAKSIEDFIKKQSIFIKKVSFLKAGGGSFTFSVKVNPIYKIFFGKRLTKRIRVGLEPRIQVGLVFDFEIVS